MNDIKANIDFDVSELKDALENLNHGMEDLAESMSTSHEKFKTQAAEKAEAFKGISAAAETMGKEFETQQKSWLEKIGNIGDEWTKTVDEMRKAGGTQGIIGEVLPRQLGGVQDSFKTFKNSMLSELPFGGLIGLMVLGGKRPEEIRAMGSRAARIFQQTGQVGQKQMQAVGDDIRRIGVMLGKGQTGLAGEFEAAASAFAAAGTDIEEVLQKKFQEPIKGSRGTILETSVALDSLFKIGAGSAAKQMADIIKNFNQSASESARIVASLGLQAREAGTSVSAFMTSVSRSSQVLRTQRVDITEVASAQLKLQKIMEESAGMREEMAAGYAERAMGQVTQGMSGLGTGITSVLGERISSRGGLGRKTVSGLEAYYAMKEGFGGEGQETGKQGIFVQSIRELINLTKEMGGTETEQRYFLEKQGFGIEGSRAIMEMGERMEEMKEMGASEKDINDAIKDNQKDLTNAFKNQAEETSDFQKALIKVQNGIAKIGAGLLSATVSGIQNLTEIGRLIWNYMTGGSDEEKDFIIQEIQRNSKRSTAAVDQIIGGVKEAYSGIEQGVDTTLGFGIGGSREDRRKAFYKSKGMGEEIGGKFLTSGEAEEVRRRAKYAKSATGAQEFEALLGHAGIRSETEITGSMRGEPIISEKRGTLHNELMSAFRSGGREAVISTARELREQGKLKKLKPGQLGALAEGAEAEAGRTEIDIQGTKFEVGVVSKVEVKQKTSSKPAEDG